MNKNKPIPKAQVRKTSHGWQVYAAGPKGHIAQGQPHKDLRAAKRDAKKFEEVDEADVKKTKKKELFKSRKFRNTTPGQDRDFETLDANRMFKAYEENIPVKEGEWADEKRKEKESSDRLTKIHKEREARYQIQQRKKREAAVKSEEVEIDEQLPVGHRQPSPGSDSTASYARLPEDAPTTSTAGVANWNPLLGGKRPRVVYKKRRSVDGRTKDYKETVTRLQARRDATAARELEQKLNMFGVQSNPFREETQMENKKYLITKEGSIEDAVLHSVRTETPVNPNDARPTLHLPKKYLSSKEGSLENAVTDVMVSETISGNMQRDLMKLDRHQFMAKYRMSKATAQSAGGGIQKYGRKGRTPDADITREEVEDAFDYKAKKGAIAAPGSGSIAKPKKAKSSDVNKSIEQQMADARKEEVEIDELTADQKKKREASRKGPYQVHPDDHPAHRKLKPGERHKTVKGHPRAPDRMGSERQHHGRSPSHPDAPANTKTGEKYGDSSPIGTMPHKLKRGVKKVRGDKSRKDVSEPHRGSKSPGARGSRVGGWAHLPGPRGRLPEDIEIDESWKKVKPTDKVQRLHQLSISGWLSKQMGRKGDPHKFNHRVPSIYFDDVDLVVDDKTVVRNALKSNVTMADLLKKIQAHAKKNRLRWESVEIDEKQTSGKGYKLPRQFKDPRKEKMVGVKDPRTGKVHTKVVDKDDPKYRHAPLHASVDDDRGVGSQAYTDYIRNLTPGESAVTDKESKEASSASKQASAEKKRQVTRIDDAVDPAVAQEREKQKGERTDMKKQHILDVAKIKASKVGEEVIVGLLDMGIIQVNENTETGFEVINDPVANRENLLRMAYNTGAKILDEKKVSSDDYDHATALYKDQWKDRKIADYDKEQGKDSRAKEMRKDAEVDRKRMWAMTGDKWKHAKGSSGEVKGKKSEVGNPDPKDAYKKEELSYHEQLMGEADKWIQKAIKRPGALHRDLGVPEDEKIPKSKIKAAAKEGGKVGQRARLAITLGKMNK